MQYQHFQFIKHYLWITSKVYMIVDESAGTIASNNVSESSRRVANIWEINSVTVINTYLPVRNSNLPRNPSALIYEGKSI